MNTLQSVRLSLITFITDLFHQHVGNMLAEIRQTCPTINLHYIKMCTVFLNHFFIIPHRYVGFYCSLCISQWLQCRCCHSLAPKQDDPSFLFLVPSQKKRKWGREREGRRGQMGEEGNRGWYYNVFIDPFSVYTWYNLLIGPHFHMNYVHLLVSYVYVCI